MKSGEYQHFKAGGGHIKSPQKEKEQELSEGYKQHHGSVDS